MKNTSSSANRAADCQESPAAEGGLNDGDGCDIVMAKESAELRYAMGDGQRKPHFSTKEARATLANYSSPHSVFTSANA